MTDVPLARGDRLPTDARFYNRIREELARPPEWARTFNIKNFNPTVVKVNVTNTVQIPPWMAMRIGMSASTPLKQLRGELNHTNFYQWLDWPDEPAFNSTDGIFVGGYDYAVAAANVQPLKAPGVMECVVSGIVPGFIAHTGTSGQSSGVATHLGAALEANPEGGGHWQGIHSWNGTRMYGSQGYIANPTRYLLPGNHASHARLVWLDPNSTIGDGSWGLIQISPAIDPPLHAGWIQTGNLNTAWNPIGTYKLKVGRPCEWIAVAQINFVPTGVTANRHYITVSGTQYTIAYIAPRATVSFRWAVYRENGTFAAQIGQLMEHTYPREWHEAAQGATASTTSVVPETIMLNSVLSTAEQPSSQYAGLNAIEKFQLCIEGKITTGLPGAATVRGAIMFTDGVFKNSRGWNEFSDAGLP